MKMKRRWRNKKKKVKIRRSEVEGQAANMAARTGDSSQGAKPHPLTTTGAGRGPAWPSGPPTACQRSAAWHQLLLSTPGDGTPGV